MAFGNAFICVNKEVAAKLSQYAKVNMKCAASGKSAEVYFPDGSMYGGHPEDVS